MIGEVCRHLVKVVTQAHVHQRSSVVRNVGHPRNRNLRKKYRKCQEAQKHPARCSGTLGRFPFTFSKLLVKIFWHASTSSWFCEISQLLGICSDAVCHRYTASCHTLQICRLITGWHVGWPSAACSRDPLRKSVLCNRPGNIYSERVEGGREGALRPTGLHNCF